MDVVADGRLIKPRSSMGRRNYDHKNKEGEKLAIKMRFAALFKTQ